MRVVVAVADSASQTLVELDVPEGTTVADALRLAVPAEPAIAARVHQRDAVGIWGRPVPLDRVLREGDRLETYRAIRADAKAMRRERAGLSASTRRRSGS